MSKTILSSPTLIALGGLNFTGKTTLGRRLQQALGVPLLLVDELREFIYGKTLKYKDDQVGDYFQLSRCYPIQLAAADALLTLGDSVMIEGTLSLITYRNKLKLTCETRNAVLKLIILKIPEEKEEMVIRGRVLEREAQNPSGASSFEDYLRVKAKFEMPVLLPHLAIDSTQPIEDCVAQALAYIQS